MIIDLESYDGSGNANPTLVVSTSDYLFFFSSDLGQTNAMSSRVTAYSMNVMCNDLPVYSDSHLTSINVYSMDDLQPSDSLSSGSIYSRDSPNQSLELPTP